MVRRLMAGLFGISAKIRLPDKPDVNSSDDPQINVVGARVQRPLTHIDHFLVRFFAELYSAL
jgi:hypothetical protein